MASSLLIDEILEMMFSYCDALSLTIFERVNKQWLRLTKKSGYMVNFLNCYKSLSFTVEENSKESIRITKLIYNALPDSLDCYSLFDEKTKQSTIEKKKQQQQQQQKPSAASKFQLLNKLVKPALIPIPRSVKNASLMQYLLYYKPFLLTLPKATTIGNATRTFPPLQMFNQQEEETCKFKEIKLPSPHSALQMNKCITSSAGHLQCIATLYTVHIFETSTFECIASISKTDTLEFGKPLQVFQVVLEHTPKLQLEKLKSLQGKVKSATVYKLYITFDSEHLYSLHEYTITEICDLNSSTIVEISDPIEIFEFSEAAHTSVHASTGTVVLTFTFSMYFFVNCSLVGILAFEPLNHSVFFEHVQVIQIDLENAEQCKISLIHSDETFYDFEVILFNQYYSFKRLLVQLYKKSSLVVSEEENSKEEKVKQPPMKIPFKAIELQYNVNFNNDFEFVQDPILYQSGKYVLFHTKQKASRLYNLHNVIPPLPQQKQQQQHNKMTPSKEEEEEEEEVESFDMPLYCELEEYKRFEENEQVQVELVHDEYTVKLLKNQLKIENMKNGLVSVRKFEQELELDEEFLFCCRDRCNTNL